jgi:hypothetical protein
MLWDQNPRVVIRDCPEGFLRYARSFFRSLTRRSFTRLTNFNPDHTSVTAHTFTSTSPASSPISRTIFPSKSVAIPELFFGQLTHNMPAGARSLDILENSLINSARDLEKIIAKSSVSRCSCFTISHSAIASCNVARTSAGALANCTRNPALIPNFFGSGVPEYPGVSLIARHKTDIYRFESELKAKLQKPAFLL